MKIRFALCTILATGLLIGCKKELQPQESSTDSTAVATATAPTQNQEAAQPAEMAAPVAQPAAPAPVSTQTAPGMNPPHGQPGHRCDIAVGAPLSSAPAKPATTPAQKVNVTPTPTATVTPTANQAPAILNAPTEATAPGMNPPHGQPGHRCDIAVGQPLPKA